MPTSISILMPSGIETIEISDSLANQAGELEYGHQFYFELQDGTISVPISSLILSRARPEGIANAVKLMNAAREGRHPRRGPISVTKWEDGRFRVVDGNSTSYIAAAAGWPDVPCMLLEKPPGHAPVDTTHS